MSTGLTREMADCLAAIRRLTIDGVAPSYDELRADLGLGSKSEIFRLVRSLKERGFLRALPGQARSLYVVDEEDLSPARLERMDSAALRRAAALIAGILAQRDGNAAAGAVFHRVADAIEHRPRGNT